MKTKRGQLGALGEEIACRYLKNEGFVIIDKNYWKSQGEIDIIAKKGESLHFVEVKSVSWNFGVEEVAERGIRPEENLHSNKLKRLFRAIQIYLLEHKISDDTKWQIDAIFVFIDQKTKKSKIEYYEHISLE